MKLVSNAALAALLLAGAATVATPAIAQKKSKKGEAPAAPQLKLSEPVRKALMAGTEALKANDLAGAQAQVTAAEAAATTDDDRYAINAYLKLQLLAKGTDQKVLLPVLDLLIASPKTPPADQARYNFFRGKIAFDAKKYAEAIPYLTRARDLGYDVPDFALQVAQAKIETGDVPGGLAELQKAVDAETAAGRKAPESWYNYAIGKAYTANLGPDTTAWLQKLVRAYPTAANWRKAILVFRDGYERKGAKPLDRSQRVDLFRLMRATKSLADQGDYLEYADSTLSAGLPYETKAVLDEGRSTGKIPAGNATATQISASSANAIRADTPLATLEKNATTSPNGKLASQAGDVFLGQGNYAKAIPLYQAALSKGGVDTSEVNLRLGMALTQSGQAAQAKTAFAAVTSSPRKEIAAFWLQWLESAPAA